ncbi:MAG TPA: ABC transporter permease [Anaerolineaceae bacterium]|nr:ABC transporter permease [Anaerolineaceae bacterium]
MLKSNSRWVGLSFRLGAILLALLFTAIVILVSNANPIAVFSNIINGAFGSVDNIANVFVAWVPLLVVTSGLLVTFAAGLWNIGIEGQITLGAIFTTFVLRSLQNSSVSPTIILILGILAGIVGGALWASLAGALKIYGGVSEIFGGLGLNFVATAITLWLIFGPWKRPGIGSMSGTQPFPDTLFMPVIGELRLSIWTIIIGVAGIILVYVLLNGTYFGLRLKAVGKNMRSAFLLGIPTNRYMMLSFLICGAFAGIAGALQVEAVYHRLTPSISSGYGFLGLLVAMLVNYQAIWVAPVALFFAILNIGSIQLPIVLQLDSSLGGVLQEALVLIVIMMEGVRRRLVKKE